jgi:peptidoglycan/xylan/chitin deacetylase (PgdA/CDA1 family)
MGTFTGVVPLIPCYHVVSDEDVPHVKHLYKFKDVRNFKKDLDAFLRLYQPIALHDLLESLKNCQPLSKNTFLIQFDDGFREQYEIVAPILWEKGITATFFITVSSLDNQEMVYKNKVSLLIEHLSNNGSEPKRRQIRQILGIPNDTKIDLGTALLTIDYANKNLLDEVAKVLNYDFSAYLFKSRPYLTSDEVRKLIAMGFTIGAHSLDHPQYSLISFEDQVHQTSASMRFLRERFSLDYGVFAFPHGDDNLSERFFEQIFTESDIDASFGNIALKHIPRSHFARLPMDNASMPAERVVARFYAKTLYDLAVGRRAISERKWNMKSSLAANSG